jgi:hypothetical protein
MKTIAEDNLKLQIEVVELKALIKKIETEKKLHKAKMKHGAIKYVAFVFTLFVVIFYALVNCVRGHSLL